MDASKVLPRKDALSRQLSDASSPHPKDVLRAQREVELLNHCFGDTERFFARLQQAADIQRSRKQSKKEKSRKKSKKNKQEYAVTTEHASPPSEQEFVDIFQKMKYSFCLLPPVMLFFNGQDPHRTTTEQDRLKTSNMEPTSEELLRHLFVPLDLMVKTTGGPNLAAGVSSPALTSGAISLLQNNLTPNEKELWNSLGPNWTQSYSQQAVPMSPYNPVFLDGWKPKACDENGQAFEDPVESQKKYETMLERQQSRSSQALQTIQDTEEEIDEDPRPEQLYHCSYDFVARNSSELSVLRGEHLQVLDSSKRWWKCRNNYDQIGFVPSTILEPFNHTELDSSVVMRRPSKKVPLSPMGDGRFSYVPTSPSGENHTHREPRPFSMPVMGGDEERVLLVNNELAQRLAKGKVSMRPSMMNKASDNILPLKFDSSPSEVQDWLKAKGFSDNTVSSLGILTGAQLFSLSKSELCLVSPQEGARVYSQIMVQKVQFEKEKKATELEAVMKKQKMKVDPNIEEV